MRRLPQLALLCLGISLGAPDAASQTAPEAPAPEPAAPRLNDPLARIQGETIFAGLQLHWRNVFALANIQRRFTSTDPNLATQAERLRVRWERKFAAAAEAMVDEGKRRDAAFSESFPETMRLWREEESADFPSLEVAADFLRRIEAALDGEYYLDALSPLLAFVPEYRDAPHREFDDNFWIMPDAFVIERRAVTNDTGGITSSFNGTPHSPWVWVRQPMSWGPSESSHRSVTRDANAECGNGKAGLALLAEPLSPLTLRGLEETDNLKAFFSTVKNNFRSTGGFVPGPWFDEPITLETRASRNWCSVQIVLERPVDAQSKVAVASRFHLTVADGWLLYVATRYGEVFPADHTLTEADTALLLKETERYQPLFNRIVNSVEIRTYTDSREEQAPE